MNIPDLSASSGSSASDSGSPEAQSAHERLPVDAHYFEDAAETDLAAVAQAAGSLLSPSLTRDEKEISGFSDGSVEEEDGVWDDAQETDEEVEMEELTPHDVSGVDSQDSTDSYPWSPQEGKSTRGEWSIPS